MKAWIVAIAGALALLSLPANADHRHYRGRYFYPSVSFGYTVGYPYYRPYGHFYPSSYIGVGFNLGPRYRTRRVRSDEARSEVRMQKLYVYPAAGQSEERTAEDRYQCHVWAADSSSFDPTLGAGSAAEAADYGRAFTACMEGRDYVVK